MKKLLFPAVVLVCAFAAATSHADTVAQNPATTAARTRAEVKAELAQARRDGQLATDYATYPSLAVVNAVPVRTEGGIVLTQRRSAAKAE